MIVLVHDVPGRLRFIAPRAKRDQRAMAALRRRARAAPGVVTASANPLTGSLVVNHDGAPATRERILTALNAADPGSGLAPPPLRLRREPIQASGSGLQTRRATLLDIIANAVVERAVRMAVAALL